MESAIKRILKYLDLISPLNIVVGIKNYLPNSWMIIRHPFSFLDKVNSYSPDQVKKSWSHFYFGIALSFFILVPIMMIHENYISKLSYLIFSTIRMISSAFFTYCAMIILGGRMVKLGYYFSISLLYYGTVAPLYILIDLPSYYRCGIDRNGAAFTYSQCQSYKGYDDFWMVIYNAVMTLLSLIILLSSVKVTFQVFEVSKKKILFLFIALGGFMMPCWLFFEYIGSEVVEIIDKYLQFL